MGQASDLKSLSDTELLRRLSTLVGQSRRVEADLVAHIGEVEARRLYRREASPSMFEYCRRILHLSEAEAYLRIAVARASRQHPGLLERFRDGRLHLSGIERLAPHLTAANRDVLLKRATHKSKREIEELVAELAPRRDVGPTMRKLPERPQALSSSAPELRPNGVATASAQLRPDGLSTGSVEPLPPGVIAPPSASPARATVVEPLAPARYKVCFTASAELREKIERLQALMRSSVPDGDLAKVIDRAVTRELGRLEAKRFAKTKRPRKALAQTDTRPSSRHIPAPVRRSVHARDGGRCTYKTRQGRRCTKRHDLEFHHKNPYGRGGDHSPDNLALMCRAHNTLLAEHDYGKEVMARFRRPGGRVGEEVAGCCGGPKGRTRHGRRTGYESSVRFEVASRGRGAARRGLVLERQPPSKTVVHGFELRGIAFSDLFGDRAPRDADDLVDHDL